MKDTKRILIVIAIIAVLSGIMITVDYMRTQGILFNKNDKKARHVYNGSLPVYNKGVLIGQFTDKVAGSLTMTSFIDSVENREQAGWRLKDVIQKYIKDATSLQTCSVRIASTKRQKYSFMAWEEIDNEDNKILLVPGRKGTLKLASPMKGLDTRETWIQDVDRIDILQQ